jgi:hypothetical protein
MYSILEKFLICHKFYDKKNRRISAFADYQGASLKIYVITCSNKDTFSRSMSRQNLVEYLNHGHLKSYKADPENAHPQIFSIPTTPDGYKHDFLNFLHENYFIKEQMQVGVIGTNKMVVADVYRNSITREIRVTNTRVRTISDKELEAYNKEIEQQQKHEADFEAYMQMVGKLNGTNPNSAN